MNTQKRFLSTVALIVGLVIVVGGIFILETKDGISDINNTDTYMEDLDEDPSTNHVADDSVVTKDSVKKTENSLTMDVSDGKGGTKTITPKVLSVDEFNENSVKNLFETFGDVTFNSGNYILSESADAGFFTVLTSPTGYSELSFNYKFLKPGDGDFLTINVKNLNKGFEDIVFNGRDLAITRDDYIQGIVELGLYGEYGDKFEIIFTLVSRGEKNSVLSIKDLEIKVY